MSDDVQTTEQEPSETRRIHFITGFEAYEGSHPPKLYTCKRCGEQLIGSRACYEHRKGLLSDCNLNRFQSIFR